MPQDALNEREFELVNIVGAQLAANQRELSRHMDLSLGMTNMLLKRLITKGYIRIKQLNQKKVEYLLTPKGFAEKMRKSVKYTLKTINSIGLVRRQLHAIIEGLYTKGERIFYIVGTSDLAELVEMSLNQSQWAGVKFSRAAHVPNISEGIVLICREGEDASHASHERCIDLVEELSKDKALTTQ